MAAGGTAPIKISRMIPPVFAATKDSTKTPNTSSLRLTPAIAPLSAKTKVPARSNTYGSVSMTLFPQTTYWRTHLCTMRSQLGGEPTRRTLNNPSAGTWRKVRQDGEKNFTASPRPARFSIDHDAFYTDSHARVATISVSTPVARVGWMTGANFGL